MPLSLFAFQRFDHIAKLTCQGGVVKPHFATRSEQRKQVAIVCALAQSVDQIPQIWHGPATRNADATEHSPGSGSPTLSLRTGLGPVVIESL